MSPLQRLAPWVMVTLSPGRRFSAGEAMDSSASFVRRILFITIFAHVVGALPRLVALKLVVAGERHDTTAGAHLRGNRERVPDGLQDRGHAVEDARSVGLHVLALEGVEDHGEVPEVSLLV